ncbi:hypothetical protein BC834DRAFT_260378 [Gloeopeniophorella convolvens]|nr:hypothetical protein BC834DRAFT_260378 [Gloeopeniophorella convolvens]
MLCGPLATADYVQLIRQRRCGCGDTRRQSDLCDTKREAGGAGRREGYETGSILIGQGKEGDVVLHGVLLHGLRFMVYLMEFPANELRGRPKLIMGYHRLWVIAGMGQDRFDCSNVRWRTCMWIRVDCRRPDVVTNVRHDQAMIERRIAPASTSHHHQSYWGRGGTDCDGVPLVTTKASKLMVVVFHVFSSCRCTKPMPSGSGCPCAI